MESHIFWTCFLFLLGACVGSFLNVVIYRLPRGASIVFPGSHCPSCGRGIRWYDNIPLLSWTLLGGKCRFCKTPISPRYILVEGVTGVLVAGLYVAYYVLRLRSGAGEFLDTWPVFASHACLLCGLLACALVDIESWIVPLEVCWFVSLAGVVASAAQPHAWMPEPAPATAAAAVGAAAGLGIALILLRRGLIQRSFIDADDKPLSPPPQPKRAKAGKGKNASPAPSVAMTKAHGVNPRVEVLRELLFLTPAIVLAALAALAVTAIPGVREAWRNLLSGPDNPLAPHIKGLLAGVLGYLVGGLWIWGTRILGTLGFGKEAMGMGDVHILAATGAVAGWIVPSIAFFVAPMLGLLWALALFFRRNQRELPYGPWLAAATLVVMVGYDPLRRLLEPYAQTLRELFA